MNKMKGFVIFFIVVLVVLIIYLIMGIFILYFLFGWFKKIFHDTLLWHMPKETGIESFDGVNYYSTCKYCGKKIIQDSQGNWF